MNNILINGYFGVNFGDDLFFKILFERYPEVNFSFYNNSYLQNLNKKYKEIFSVYSNVEIKKYNKLRKLFQRIGNTNIIDMIQYNKYDGTIFIGGSVFMETSYWESSYTEKASVINYFSKVKKPVFIIGSNFGPVKTYEFRIRYSELFNKCTDICFRDRYSYDLFSNEINVRLAPDIVFQLKPKNIEKIKDSIGISLIDLKERKGLSKYSNLYINKIKELVEYFIEKNKTITFFSFCEYEGDIDIINSILKIVNSKYKSKITVENYEGNIDEFLLKFESMENIIGTRFHSCILSQVFGQGLYPLIYSDKTYNVLKDIDLDKEYMFINNIDKLDHKHILKVIDNNKIKNTDIFIESEKQFKGLDRYIYGEDKSIK